MTRRTGRTLTTWVRHPILLLRDALGRFAQLRRPAPDGPRPARRRRRPTRAAVQLALF